jgi:hypothetical protein
LDNFLNEAATADNIAKKFADMVKRLKQRHDSGEKLDFQKERDNLEAQAAATAKGLKDPKQIDLFYKKFHQLAGDLSTSNMSRAVGKGIKSVHPQVKPTKGEPEPLPVKAKKPEVPEEPGAKTGEKPKEKPEVPAKKGEVPKKEIPTKKGAKEKLEKKPGEKLGEKPVEKPGKAPAKGKEESPAYAKPPAPGPKYSGLKPGQVGYATEMEKGFVDHLNGDETELGSHSDEMNEHTKNIFNDLVSKGQLKKGVRYSAKQTAGDKEYKLTGDWTKYGATNNEPKTDVIIAHPGGEYRCSVKTGENSQLMSGKGSEALATLMAGAKAAKKNIETMPEFKKLQKHLTRMTEKHVFPTEFGLGMKSGAKWAVDFDKQNKEATDLLNQILNNSKELKREMIREAMTGNAKFGENSPAAATHLLIIDGDPDGKGNQLLPISDDTVDEIGKHVDWKINVKSDSEKVGGKKTGRAIGRVVLRAYYSHSKRKNEGISIPNLDTMNDSEMELIMEATKKKVSKEQLQKAIEEYLEGGIDNILDFFGANVEIEEKPIDWVKIGHAVEKKMKKQVDVRPAMKGIKDAFKKKGFQTENLNSAQRYDLMIEKDLGVKV